MEPEDPYKKAAIAYPLRLERSRRRYLMTKPFGETAWGDDFCGKLRELAQIVDLLRLPPGASILDVGCGPGWVAEWLTRISYDVVGIDISPEMIRIARKRVRRIGVPRWGRGLRIAFEVADAESSHLGRRFDAAIVNDALHHFRDERAVLQCVFEHLRPGGRILLKEPGEHHADDEESRRESAEFGVLERGLTREELLAGLEGAGFHHVVALAPVDLILDEAHAASPSHMGSMAAPSGIHFLMATRPGPGGYDSRWPSRLRAEIEVEGVPARWTAGERTSVKVVASNVGDTLWLAAPRREGGFVRVGVKLLDREHRLVDDGFGSALFSGDVGAGEGATVEVELKTPVDVGDYVLRFDLVDERLTWFESVGSMPVDLRVSVVARASI